MPIAKSTRLGPYEVIPALGSGGMGEVYLAEDARLHRKVALKILPADLASDRNRMNRFNQEAMAAAALPGPRIRRRAYNCTAGPISGCCLSRSCRATHCSICFQKYCAQGVANHVYLAM